MEMSFNFGILLNHFLKFNPSRILFCSNSNTICFQKFQTRAMHIRIAQWRIELTTSFSGNFLFQNCTVDSWRLGRWYWTIIYFSFDQFECQGIGESLKTLFECKFQAGVSEAGRAKVNDCIISKLINTDNKMLEDFVLIFLLWLLCYQS